MDNDSDNVSFIIQIEDDEESHNGCSIRRNTGQGSMVGPFVRRIEMNISNITLIKSQTAGVFCRSHLNPNGILISLHNLIMHGYQHGTVLVVFILSISLAPSGQTHI